MDVEAAKDPKRGVHQRLECLYNSMLWPVKNFTAKGFLWYQGESNISNYQFYAPMMTAWCSYGETYGRLRYAFLLCADCSLQI